jgi:hypothetical protein
MDSNMGEIERTAWHFLGPGTGFIIGITLTIIFVWLSKKI